MIIAVSGTPGTGKTELAKALARKLGWQCISLNDLAEEEKIYSGFDDDRACWIIDMKRMYEQIHLLEVSHRNIVIESHYAHEMPADVVIILRTSLKELKERMLKKGWPEKKIRENLEAETREVIKTEAVKLKRNVYEIDTSGKTPNQVAKQIMKMIKGEKFIRKDIVIPEKLQWEFRKPYGKVLKGSWEGMIEKIRKGLGEKHVIISVGDLSSYYLTKYGIHPNMIIVDGKEKRKPFKKEIKFKGELIRVENPPGQITLDLWKAIEDAIPKMGKKRYKILVHGEEDLAVLPCMIFAPLNSHIFYGHYLENAMIWVKLDKKMKKEAFGLLETILFFQ